MSTLETQYRKFLEANQKLKLSFEEWKKVNARLIKQALINMMKDDEELGLYDEPTKCYCSHTVTCDCGPEEPKQETLEEAFDRIFDSLDYILFDFTSFEQGAKWQQERSQSIVPFDAYNIEVFKIEADEQGKLFAYIGYKITNGNFHFNVVPFTEPKQETLEESAKEFFRKFKHTHSPDNYYLALVEFAKWQQERRYSEEEVIDIAKQAFILGKDFGLIGTFNEWFETVKKK